MSYRIFVNMSQNRARLHRQDCLAEYRRSLDEIGYFVDFPSREAALRALTNLTHRETTRCEDCVPE
jgi:hypothetical protein